MNASLAFLRFPWRDRSDRCPQASRAPASFRRERTIAKASCCSFSGRPGQVIECRRGDVWVTQDRDRRDVVLKAGERHVVDRPGRVIAYALQEAVVAVD